MFRPTTIKSILLASISVAGIGSLSNAAHAQSYSPIIQRQLASTVQRAQQAPTIQRSTYTNYPTYPATTYTPVNRYPNPARSRYRTTYQDQYWRQTGDMGNYNRYSIPGL